MSFSSAGNACSIAAVSSSDSPVRASATSPVRARRQGRHPVARGGGDLQPGRAPVGGVGFAAQQAGVDELVHQRADGVGGQVQFARGRGDADARLVGDHAQDLDLRAGQREARHVGPVGAHAAAHHPADPLDGAQQPFGEFGHAAKVALTQNY